MDLNSSNNSTVNTSSILQTEKFVDVHGIIENLLSGLIFLLPLFFLSFTADAFSLNKSYLVMLTAVLSLLLFMLDALRKRKLHVRSLSSYLPFFIILLGSLISTYFSTNRRVSMFGYFGNYESSFIFIFSLVLIGFVSSNVKVNFSKIIKFFFSGVSLSVLISLVAFYLKFIPGLGQTGNSFSLVGNNNLLVGLEVVVILGSFYKLGNLAIKDIRSTLLFGFFISISTIHLLVVGNFLALAFIFVTIFYLFITSKVDFAKTRKVFMPIAVMVIFVTFINYFSVTREVFGIQSFQEAHRLPLTESWLVSVQSVRDFPFVGTGLGTFVTDFTRYRPASLNVGDAWEARFSFPYNDIFLWLATAGLIGLTLYILFWVLVIKDSFKIPREGKDAYFISYMVLITFISLMFFGNSVSLYALLFVMIGIVINHKESSFITMHSIGQIGVASFIAFILTCAFGYQAYGVYTGQIKFLQSLVSNNASERYQLQADAILADKTESVYIRSFIDTSLFIARSVSQKEKPTEADKSDIQNLVSNSVENARLLTEVINPLDVSNWEIRGQVYDALSGIAENSDQFASSAYTNAINLESTNPRLWLRLGSVYYRQKDYASAVQSFARSVQLKSDYANAQYNLAFALRDAGDLPNALIRLEIVQRLIPAGSEDAKRLEQDIVDMKNLIDQAKANSKVSAQEQVSSVPIETPAEEVQVSEPLTNPSEQEANQIEPIVEAPLANPAE